MNEPESSGRKMMTKEQSSELRKIMDPRLGIDYSKDIVTTRLYCACQDCRKYCNYKEPVKCIDPFLVDMRNTYWIYHGLVMASKTERAISFPDKTNEKPKGNVENTAVYLM